MNKLVRAKNLEVAARLSELPVVIEKALGTLRKLGKRLIDNDLDMSTEKFYDEKDIEKSFLDDGKRLYILAWAIKNGQYKLARKYISMDTMVREEIPEKVLDMLEDYVDNMK